MALSFWLVKEEIEEGKKMKVRNSRRMTTTGSFAALGPVGKISYPPINLR
jgi:hypothetical protein